MKNNNIGAGQLVLLLFVTRTFAVLTLSPDVASDISSISVLIGEFIAVPISFLLMLPVFMLFKKHPNTDITSLSIKGLGKGGYAVSIIYMLFFFAVLVSIVSEFVFFMLNAIFPDAEVLSVLIVFILAVVYAAKMGLSGVTRAACIVSFFLAVMLIAIFIAGIGKANFINLKPVSETSLYQLISAVILIVSKDVELIFLMFLCVNVKGNMVKSTAAYIFVSCAIMATTTFIGIAIFGDYVRQLEYPIFTLTSVLEFGFLQRIYAIEMMFWVVTAFFRATVCMIVLTHISSLIMPKKARQFSVWIIALLATICVLIVTYNVRSVNAPYRFGVRGIPTILVLTVIPAIVLISLRKKRGDVS